MEQSSFFNSVSGDRKYKAEDWASYFGSFIGNGVFPVPSTGLQVVAGNGMQITVKAGKAWINGYFYNNTSDLSLTLATADGVLNRIDRIVVRWDLTNRVISAKVKSSSYSASPTAPAVERDADIYELAIADVYVGAGVTAITGSSITDKRLDSTVCGVVAGLVDTIDTTAFNAQLEAWFGEFTAQSESDFDAWFATIQDVLDENTATALYNMITAHTSDTDNPHNVTPASIGAAAAQDVEAKLDKSGGTMTGALIAGGTLDPATAQVRNILVGTSEPDLSAGNDGDIYIQYTV